MTITATKFNDSTMIKILANNQTLNRNQARF